MALYKIQAKQFGRTMISTGIIASSREDAIKRFRTFYHVSGGYVINAQKSKRV